MPQLLTLTALKARFREVDTKDGLKPFWNQRITVEAEFSRFGKTNHRRVIAVQNITLDEQLIAHHCWIPFSAALKKLHLRRGVTIRFEGRVIRYVKHDPTLFFYGFDDIRAPQRVNRKVTL